MNRKNNITNMLPIQTRMAILENAAEDRIFNVVFTTGAIVRKYNFFADELYDEELVVDKNSIRLERLNSGSAPVLDTHSDFELENIKGVVIAGSAKIDAGNGFASLKIDNGPENEAVIRKLKDGIIKNVSVGYRVHKYEVIRQDGTVPIYRAVDWEPYEISLVPIGADAGAGIRSNPYNYPCEIINLNHNQQEITMNKPLHGASDAPDKNQLDTNSAENKNQSSEGGEQRNLNDVSHAAEKNKAPTTISTPVDTASAVAEGVKLERARVAEINNITRAAKLPETFAQKLINDGVSIQKARKRVLNELANISNEEGEIRSQTYVTRDESDKQKVVIENALLNRFNPDKYKLDSAAREFRGMSLMEIGRDVLERKGIKTRGLSRVQLAGAILGLEGRSGSHGTSDFPNILANIANKTLRDAYEAAPQTFKSFCRQTTAPDFKTMARVQLGDAPTLEKVNENGEFKRGSVSDAKEQYALATYGKVVAINRQVIINDDLGAFTRLPSMFGRAAADLESDTVWGIITANAAMGDGVTLFHANHGNLAASGAVISVATLGAGRAALRQQKGLNGRFINVMPKYLIVPSAIETTAQQFVTITNVVYTKNPDVNPFAGTLQVVAEPRLDSNSATSWYLAGDPSQIDTIEYAYLEGNEGVYLESRVGFDVDGLELKARLDFAAKAIDHRGFYKNPGA